MCHTQQAGCKAVCYDASTPLPLRFWAFQVTLVAVPSALYMGFILCITSSGTGGIGKGEDGRGDAELPREKGREASGAGSSRLLWAYVVPARVRLALEGQPWGASTTCAGSGCPAPLCVV